MSCNKTRQGRKRYCLSDFRHRIQILKGNIISTTGDYDVSNTEPVLTCRAKVKTTSGTSYYNGVSMDNTPSHKFTVPFVKNISIEKNYMILMNGDYYNIDNVINENEDNLYFIISANKTGSQTKEANWR